MLYYYSVYTYSTNTTQSDNIEEHFSPKQFYTDQELNLKSYQVRSSMSSSSYYETESVKSQDSTYV